MDQFIALQRLCFLLCFGLVLSTRPVRAEDGTVSASIINLLPQGRSSILILNRGLKAGVQVGQVARCSGPPAFPCRVTESYEFRSKCIVEAEASTLGLKGACRIAPPTRTRSSARVVEVIPEGETTTLVFDKGHREGVRLSDHAELDGKPCRIWRLEDERAACALESIPAVVPRELTVVSAFLATGTPLPAPLIAPPPELAHDRPARGSQDRARPVAIVRANGHGLVPASRCVGFTPDERAAFILVPGTTGLPPFTDVPMGERPPIIMETPMGTRRIARARSGLRRSLWGMFHSPDGPGCGATRSLAAVSTDERGLELHRIDLSTAGTTVVHTFEPARVLEARRQLQELSDRERLLACHMAETSQRSSSGDKGLMAHHRLDQILFWSADDVIYAAMEGGAGLAERVGRGPLDAVWFVPGFARHLGQTDERWQVLEVR